MLKYKMHRIAFNTPPVIICNLDFVEISPPAEDIVKWKLEFRFVCLHSCMHVGVQSFQHISVPAFSNTRGVAGLD